MRPDRTEPRRLALVRGGLQAGLLALALLAPAPLSAVEVWRWTMPDGSVGMADDPGRVPADALQVTREIVADPTFEENGWGARLRRWLDARAEAGRRAAARNAAAARIEGTREQAEAEREALLERARRSGLADQAERQAWQEGPPPADDPLFGEAEDPDWRSDQKNTPGAARNPFAAGGRGAQIGPSTGAGSSGPAVPPLPNVKPQSLRELAVLALTASWTSGLFLRGLIALVLLGTAVAVWKLAALSPSPRRRWFWRLAALTACALWLGLAMPPVARAWQVDFAALVDAWQGRPAR